MKVADIQLGQENTFTVNIPSDLVNESYLFMRVGAKASATAQFSYTQVQKIALK